MRYLGGKTRIAKEISEAILQNTQSRSIYIEPFIGGGAVATKMGSHFETAYYSDIHPDLIMLYRNLQNGWEPPREISEEQYKELRNSEPSALRAIAGFGGSFGGKWFGGYARGTKKDGTSRNYVDEAVRSLLRDFPSMCGEKDTVFYEGSYLNFDSFIQHFGTDIVVYCDPPYANTTKYSSTEDFDHNEFWKTMSKWSEAGAKVFVSEYDAPQQITAVVWEKELRQLVNLVKQDRKMVIERLYMLK